MPEGQGAVLRRAGQNRAVVRAIGSIPEDAWTPVCYPGTVLDPDTGELISDADVAEITFTAFASTKHLVTARLVARRVRDQAKLEELFPVWRYHPFFTNSRESTVEADLTHRGHTVIKAVFADLIDRPLVHMPPGRFAANSAWAACAMITHNLLRAATTLSTDWLAVAPGATLRREIVYVPERLARRQRRPCCTYPSTGPGPTGGWRSGTERSARHSGHQQRPDPSTRPAGTTGDPSWKDWEDQRNGHVPDMYARPTSPTSRRRAAVASRSTDRG